MIFTISPEKLAELESLHEDGHLLTGPEGHQVFVNRPGRKEWKRFQNGAEQLGKRLDAYEQLLQDCRVFPEKGTLDEMLNKRPALGMLFGSRCVDLGGMVGEAEIKKR